MLSFLDRSQDYPDNGDPRGDIQIRLNSAHEAVEYARKHDPARLPQMLTTYAHLLASDGQYEQAKAYADEVLAIEPNSVHAVEAIVAAGISAALTNDLEEAERSFMKAADLSRKIGYLPGLVQALQFLVSQVLIVRGQFQLALTYIEEANLISEELGGKDWIEPFIRGLIFEITGDRRHCRQMLDELVMRIEPGTRAAAAYYFLWARLALDEEELEQAKEYLRLGLRVALRAGAVDLNLLIRLEHSRYHRLVGEAAVARDWAEDALQQAQIYGSHYFTALALIERGQANFDAGDLESAEANLDEASRLIAPLRGAYDMARIHFLRALWSKQTGQPDAESLWITAARAIIRDGYAFILEKEQDLAFHLIASHTRSKNPEVRTVTDSLLRHLANVPPPPLRITAFGQFAVWKGRRRIPDQAWTRRKAGELLRYLLLQPNRAAGKEVIIEALWPDHESGSPADLLHQATSALRHALEPDLPDKFPSRYLKVEGEQISLLLPPGSMVDFEHFERVLPLAIQARSVDRLLEALNLYSGEFFPADRYADWSAERRQALAELRQRGLVALARAYLEQGQHYNAINCCRQILHGDSWNEDAVLLGMQAYAGLQDVPHALQLYGELERTLKEDLGISPRADLQALAQTLKQR